MPRTPDRRYTVQREWCGHIRPQWVARFCDQWIGAAPTRRSACDLAHTFHNQRLAFAIGASA